MVTGSSGPPKAYISLPAGRGTNYARRYARQIMRRPVGTETCQRVLGPQVWYNAGTTQFDRESANPSTPIRPLITTTTTTTIRPLTVPHTYRHSPIITPPHIPCCPFPMPPHSRRMLPAKLALPNPHGVVADTCQWSDACLLSVAGQNLLLPAGHRGSCSPES